MANYVILDTSIYRELGLKFYEHVDYINLSAFTINTDGEVLLSVIVFEEFCNYYKSVLKSKTNAFQKANNDLIRDPFFKSPDNVEKKINTGFEKAIKLFDTTLKREPFHESPMAILRPTLISGLELTKFILNSREDKETNIQIRDYLIWDSVLNFAKEESEDRMHKIGRRKVVFERSLITFITKDKGFEQNQLFQDLQKKYGVDNVEVLKSIPEYLENKGFYFNYITPDLIKAKISPSRILKDLKKDIGALLSYVSPRYDDNCYDKNVEEAEINKVEVVEHYTYVDSNDGKYKFTANLKVWVRVVFEKDELGYQESLESQKDGWRSLETYDNLKRPYFEKPILFFYGGLVDHERRTIKSVRFLDYIPDMYFRE